LRFGGYPYGYGFGYGRCLYGVCESAIGHRGSGYGFGGYGLGSGYGYGGGRAGGFQELAPRPRAVSVIPAAIGIREAPSQPAAIYVVGEGRRGARAVTTATNPSMPAPSAASPAGRR
jgi:hypothetical protein